MDIADSCVLAFFRYRTEAAADDLNAFGLSALGYLMGGILDGNIACSLHGAFDQLARASERRLPAR